MRRGLCCEEEGGGEEVLQPTVGAERPLIAGDGAKMVEDMSDFVLSIADTSAALLTACLALVDPAVACRTSASSRRKIGSDAALHPTQSP